MLPAPVKHIARMELQVALTRDVDLTRSCGIKLVVMGIYRVVSQYRNNPPRPIRVGFINQCLADYINASPIFPHRTGQSSLKSIKPSKDSVFLVEHCIEGGPEIGLVASAKILRQEFPVHRTKTFTVFYSTPGGIS